MAFHTDSVTQKYWHRQIVYCWNFSWAQFKYRFRKWKKKFCFVLSSQFIRSWDKIRVYCFDGKIYTFHSSSHRYFYLSIYPSDTTTDSLPAQRVDNFEIKSLIGKKCFSSCHTYSIVLYISELSLIKLCVKRKNSITF